MGEQNLFLLPLYCRPAVPCKADCRAFS